MNFKQIFEEIKKMSFLRFYLFIKKESLLKELFLFFNLQFQ